jgi:hypothetical protein
MHHSLKIYKFTWFYNRTFHTLMKMMIELEYHTSLYIKPKLSNIWNLLEKAESECKPYRNPH